MIILFLVILLTRNRNYKLMALTVVVTLNPLFLKPQ